MTFDLSRIGHFLSGKKKDQDSKPPLFLAFRSSTLFIGAAVCIAIFSDILLYGIIVPVVPYSLTVQVGIPEHEVQQWTAILLACYSGALFLGSPIAGVYADHTSSRRLPLLIGLLALTGSTIMLCLGKSIGVLIVGRILQGLSAAIVWSVGLALLVDTTGRNVGIAMGYVSIAMSVGLLIAPLIGGGVYAAAGYYAVFYIGFGFIALDILLRLLLVEKKVARQWIPDSETEPASAIGAQEPPPPADDGDTTAVEDESAEKRDTKGDASDPSGGEDGTVPSTADAPAAEGRAKYPHWVLIKSPRMLAALFGSVIQAGVMFSFDTILPLFVKSTFHWSSTAAGLIFLALFIPGFVSPVVGWLSDRYGAKWLSLSGFVASVPLLVCLRFVTDNTIGHKVLLGALLALLGVTLAFANIPLMAEITYAIEDEERKRPGVWGEKGVYGIGYGLFCTAFALGGTAGSLMSGYIVAGSGWNTAVWVLAVWAAVGAVIVLGWVGGTLGSKEPQRDNGGAEDALAGAGAV
ncbi:Major facilitator superfamily domain-containing protein [Pleurostoma richardsiae]|uniref:Major facilitator superfamily domain-containing protein n=1 Tax=Pleurostoma richardsiae TaxID=41990 RepID=A0AA38S564_9PEZI|nr:Major facilitator superfamily domain-containing protein [Pleurostoma richardsiae]